MIRCGPQGRSAISPLSTTSARMGLGWRGIGAGRRDRATETGSRSRSSWTGREPRHRAETRSSRNSDRGMFHRLCESCGLCPQKRRGAFWAIDGNSPFGDEISEDGRKQPRKPRYYTNSTGRWNMRGTCALRCSSMVVARRGWTLEGSGTSVKGGVE